jgi:hypothetical protein
MFKTIGLILIFIACGANAFGCHPKSVDYVWNEVTSKAAYPQGYGFPVFVKDNRMFAFHHEAVWSSADGVNWTKTDLPSVKRDAYEARYIQFNNAVYALGQNQGNYVKGIRFGSTIRWTTDFKKWETLAEKSELPDRVFYGSFVFGGKIWLMGGYDGKNFHNDIWNSADGVRWQKVVEHAAWSPRNVGVIVRFKNRIWMLGGGVIDGMKTDNPNSGKEIWSSADGVKWTLETAKAEFSALGTPVVFDNKLWLVGANRNDGNFARSTLVTDDLVNWREQSAPWSPRGAVAAWVFGDKLFMTGGKYSRAENGEIKFIYSNDVWAMSKKTE